MLCRGTRQTMTQVLKVQLGISILSEQSKVTERNIILAFSQKKKRRKAKNHHKKLKHCIFGIYTLTYIRKGERFQQLRPAAM